MDDALKVMLGTAETTIAELAGLTLDSIREVRTTKLPPGIYQLQVSECEFARLEMGEDKTPTACIAMTCEVQEPIAALHWPKGDSLASDELAALVGKKHRETFFLKDLDGLGRFKAFLVDIGFTTSGAAVPLQELMQKLIGTSFRAGIKYSKNKTDPDEPYSNISLAKVKKAA